jgi:hypothetical protein
MLDPPLPIVLAFFNDYLILEGAHDVIALLTFKIPDRQAITDLA